MWQKFESLPKVANKPDLIVLKWYAGNMYVI